MDDWDLLYNLQKKFGNDDFKDLIRPLKKENGKICAACDESSVVLKIIVERKIAEGEKKEDVDILDINTSGVVGEIIEIFDEVVKNEKSIYFTVKKLERKGFLKEKKES